MADDKTTDDAASKEARKSEVKGLIKEAIGEFLAETEEKRRTDGQPKQKSGSLFENLFG